MSVREDAAAIESLIYRYAQLQDQTDLAAVAELFRYGAFIVDKVPTPFRGSDVVLAMKSAHDRMYGDGTLRTKHVTTNVLVEVDEGSTTAGARSYFVVYQQTDDFPLQPIMAGRYHDTFARIDGTWWFDERLVLTDLIGDISRHTVDSPMVEAG
jgi:3-phenylpropionate/cinnamic acid dioxygenase small subunit